MAKGYHRDGFGHEWAEINGSYGSAVYRLHEPNTILLGRTGHDLAPVDVPAEFLKPGERPARAVSKNSHGVSLRSDVGVRVGDRRGPAGSPQYLYDGKAQIRSVADAVIDSRGTGDRRWVADSSVKSDAGFRSEEILRRRAGCQQAGFTVIWS